MIEPNLPDAQSGWENDRTWEEPTHRSYGADPYWI